MKATETISKNFIEAILRLKRDTINQNELDILPVQGLNLIIGENNKIANIRYALSDGCWVIESEKINDLKWNPTLKEIVDFISNYSEKEIKDSTHKYDLSVSVGYSKISGVSLFNKFKSILHLLEYSENKEIGLEIESNFEKYYIYYDKNLISFMFTKLNDFKEDNKYFSDKELMSLLSKINYEYSKFQLNLFYSKLKRKI